MNARISILLALICVAAAAVATSALAAGSVRRSAVPCEQLLSEGLAASAMHEPTASLLSSKVVGTRTWECDYVGGSKTKLGRAIDVLWGPYSDSRAMAPGFAKKFICPVSKAACTKLIKAATLRPNLTSFLATEKALALVGVTKTPVRTIDNPAFVWKPDSSLGPLSQEAFVGVYIVSSAHFVQVGCTDLVGKTADPQCAVRVASWVEQDVT
jgi:hypothetical protein